MNEFFRRQSLSFKLILIGIIPLAFIVYLTFQVYSEKNKNIANIESAIERVNQIGDITNLIHQLQVEQKLSFDLLINNEGKEKLAQQRIFTDSVLQKLDASNDPVIKGFEEYTSLKKLTATRSKMDSGLLQRDIITHFYSSAIFRLNTLISIPYNRQTALAPFYSDMESQKLLTEITTYLGIIRANIYNVLSTRQYMVETLLGTLGAYDVYKSYDTELRLKASANTLAAYKRMSAGSDVKQTAAYIDKLFLTFKFDSTYTPEQWWSVSENSLQQFFIFREVIWRQVNKDIAGVHHREVNKRDWTLLLLIVITIIVLSFIGYTIGVITTMLSQLKKSAEKIAVGAPGSPFNVVSKDAIGSLAASITKIAENNHQLSIAASEIGKGNFNTLVVARSEEDVLANAINSMKHNLQVSINALEESEERFKQLADLMPQFVWTGDAGGSPVYFNRKWIEFAGGRGMSDVIHPADAAETANAWAVALKEGKDFVMEMRMLQHTTNEYRWFLSRSIPIKDGNGKVSKWFGTSTDIHDRKSISEALEKLVQKRTMELKRSNDELMQFAHVASHDMKEPLRKIGMFSGMLSDEFGELGSSKAKLYIGKINQASERLISLIDGVLKYSTINQDEGSVENVDLNKIIAEIVNDLEINIQQKKAVIRCGKLPVIKGIPVLMHQLFYNLLANALKFSKDDTPPLIVISASVIKPEETASNASLSMYDNYLQLMVKDNGIGFSEDFSQKIFDVFVRLNGPGKYEGTGLGLALCKKIMERHEGSIYVKSDEGKGATFYLLLPEMLIVDKLNQAVEN